MAKSVGSCFRAPLTDSQPKLQGTKRYRAEVLPNWAFGFYGVSCGFGILPARASARSWQRPIPSAKQMESSPNIEAEAPYKTRN